MTVTIPNAKSNTKKIANAVGVVVLAALSAFGIIVLVRFEREIEPKAAISTNGLECAKIARDILEEGGSAADAMISALMCESITSAHSASLSGGFVATIFKKETNTVETLIARYMAPSAATRNMFVNITKITGERAIAVPGELKGYWELHQKYGKLEWSRLFDPIIELCRRGHVVSSYFAWILHRTRGSIRRSPTLKAIFTNPVTRKVWKEGDSIKHNKLADTFEIIQKEGVDAIYNNGTIAQLMIQDIQELGGLITIEDLMQYQIRWEKPVIAQLKNNKTLYTVPVPGGGTLVAFIMNILNDYLPENESTVAMQRIAEAFKYAFAKRSELGDERFVNTTVDIVKNLTSLEYAEEIRKRILDNETFNSYEHYGAKYANNDDQGTINVNILTKNGDAIVATSTINNFFGCKIVSQRTGIILNNGIDDFSIPQIINSYGIPPAEANFIVPHKMPVSSKCPTIILNDKNDVEILIGGAGGSRITSAVSYTLLRHLYFNESIQEALFAPRIHHQLLPMHLEYEENFPQEIVEELRNMGHEMFAGNPKTGFASVTAVARDGDKLIAIFDPRRGGSAEVF